MAGAVTGLHTFGPDTGPEALSLLDGNYGLLTTGLNTLANFDNGYIDSGAVNGLVITVPAPQVVGYVDGLILQVKVAATNTIAAPTINVNALGAKTIVNSDGTALVPGQLPAGAWIQLQYEVTSGKFQLQANSGGAGNFTNGLTVTAAGRNVASLQQAAQTFGNATDNPTYAFQGSGLATASGGWAFQGGTPGNYPVLVKTNATGNTALTGTAGQQALIDSAGNGQSIANAFSMGQDASGDAALFQRANRQLYLGTNGTIRVVISAAGLISGLGPVAGAQVDMTPDTGTFTGTLTGLTTSPTGTCTWTRIGKLVLLGLPININGTSNAVTFGMTGLPAAIQPATLTQWVPCAAMLDNSVVKAGTGVIITAGSGTLTFTLNGSSSGWTNANSKGTPSSVQSQVISYLLN